MGSVIFLIVLAVAVVAVTDDVRPPHLRDLCNDPLLFFRLVLALEPPAGTKTWILQNRPLIATLTCHRK